MTSASSIQRHLGHSGRHEIVRRHNVRAVLRAVYELGPASRAAIATASGLSKPTVGTLIEQQVEAGLLRVERARIEGRDRDVFGFADGIGLAVGVSVDASGIRAALTDIRGQRSVTTEIRATPTDRSDLLAAIRDLVGECVMSAGAELDDLKALTLAVPGAVLASNGVITLSATVPALEGVSLAEELALTPSVVVSVENDANLAALGEGARGAARGERDFVAVFVGSGVGMGIVSNGTILRGAGGSAGEIGFLPIGGDPAGPEAREGGAFEHALLSAGRLDDPSSLVTLLAQAILTVQAVLDPALVVVGGAVPVADETIADLRNELTRMSPFATPVLPSLLGIDAVRIGATAHARSALLETVLGSLASDSH